jgi:hypothetical protein
MVGGAIQRLTREGLSGVSARCYEPSIGYGPLLDGSLSCDIIDEDVTLRDLRARRFQGKRKVRRMRIVYGDTHQRDLPASERESVFS